MFNVKKGLRLGLAVLGVLGIAGCGTNGSSDSDKMQVVATVYPAYDVAKAVGGDKVDVKLLVPPGAEPHDWEPTASDLKSIGKAKVFLYNGAGLEPTEKLLTADILQKAKPVELAQFVNLRYVGEDEASHDEDGHEGHTHDGQGHESHDVNQDAKADHKEDTKKDNHEEGHSHDGHSHEGHSHEAGSVDPHIWLNPENVMKEVDAVVAAFSEVDPSNKAYYEANGKAYKEKLQALDASYKAFAASISNKNLVVTHEAFGYLADQYGFKQKGIMGLSPDAEPTPEKMANLVDFIKSNQIKVIFSEALVNPKLANAIGKETGVTIYTLNPVEGLTEDQMKSGDNYLTIMEKNLATLKEALAK
ncbi:metal ABC transporter solute-binding protein, Zn/Mn family [uncultured Veillonella sp.]|uniref:metal ABC transporter solute-binding protein, Zn/Mn family n=1 Tax=uncultured Veillonella sp. TaxID=159268 RepID=UPI0025D73119|nr:zinc ABC transporter substrate-binding protein [uncultured Veillonella sp.]MDY3974115.1 zinc ABC transporter substrate-binding protein [Veillonella caviae]